MKNERRESATTLGDFRNPTPREPDPVTNPGRELLIKAHKASQKSRWTDHFILQLRAEDFIIKPAGARDTLVRAGEERATNALDVFPEFRFHPERLWRFDFAIPAAMVAVEIDGGIWMHGGGAHSRPLNIQRDVEKGNAAVILGWRVLRFTDKEIRAGIAVPLLKKLVFG